MEVMHCVECDAEVKLGRRCWQVAVADESERSWHWASACTTCFWAELPRGRRPGVRREIKGEWCPEEKISA